MGLKNSRSIRLLRQGFDPIITHFLHKGKGMIKRNRISLTLTIYPKLALNKTRYKTFELAYTHFEENYRNIIAISPSFFIKNLKKHITWLESDIFKNQYGGIENLENISKNTIGATSFSIQEDSKINTFTPLCQTQCNEESSGLESNASSTRTYKDSYQFYPPLLQPESIDYSTIDPKIALELHLPPKVPYKFVFMRYGLSGNNAMYAFLDRIGVAQLKYEEIFKDKDQSRSACFCCEYIWGRGDDQLNHKILHTIQTCDQVLILTRDPISKIKALCNHGVFKNPCRYNDDVEYSLEQDPYDVVDSTGFCNEQSQSISNQAFAYNALLYHGINFIPFAYYSHIAILPQSVEITYLDMQEIMPEKAFDTMTKLAKKFNLTFPKKEHKELYEKIETGLFRFILPITYRIELNNCATIKLYIVVSHRQNKDLCNANHTIFDVSHPLLDQVAFSMSEDDLKALQDEKETLGKVKAYMVRFLDELKKRIDYIQRNNKHENDVLEIFRGDRELCREFKTMLDKELIHIKAHRPDIIASWKYYQEFERICAEEHGIN